MRRTIWMCVRARESVSVCLDVGTDLLSSLGLSDDEAVAWAVSS